MREAGVEAVVEAESLSVVGLLEVVEHIPRIYGEFRKLVRAARDRRPAVAVLTDSPDFHLRLAPKLKSLGVKVFYLVAPQAWAWREGRVKSLQRNVEELHCIFPFEEKFFAQRGVETRYIGHPLARVVAPRVSRAEFFSKLGIPEDRPVIAICPGSRSSEIGRHLAPLADAVKIVRSAQDCAILLAAPAESERKLGAGFYAAFAAETGVQVVEGWTWDVMAHADVTLAASGTVTVEGALLGAPMVTFYRVTPVTWWIGKALVRVPHYSMVNLVAERKLVPELMQDEMTGEALAREALRLLSDAGARDEMKRGMMEVKRTLATDHDPLEYSAERVAAAVEA